jgi:hypothetical protein
MTCYFEQVPQQVGDGAESPMPASLASLKGGQGAGAPPVLHLASKGIFREILEPSARTLESSARLLGTWRQHETVVRVPTLQSACV